MPRSIRTRATLWGAIALFVCLAAVALPRAQAASQPSRLIRVRYDEWSSDCFCVEDCDDRDSMYVEVHAGSKFMPSRLRAEWPMIDQLDGFRVVTLSDEGEVGILAPAGLYTEASWRDRKPGYLVLGKDHPIEGLSTYSFDGGMTFTLELLDSLPRGAILGNPPGPKAPRQWHFPLATPIDQTYLLLPPGHAGPVKPIGIDVEVTAEGTVSSAQAHQSADSALDSPAVRAVRGWRFQAGRNCNGEPILKGSVLVRFTADVPQERGSEPTGR